MDNKRLALITGASAGIGAAFARALAERGCDVALVARRSGRLKQLGAELEKHYGVRAYAIPADLSDPTAVDDVLAALAAEGRAVDILINNAGYGLPETFAETEWADQAAFIQVMATTCAHFAHRVLPGMAQRGYGRIINVASLAGLVPGGRGHTLYGAVKAFLITFSEALAAETWGTDVKILALCPGFTLSEFHDANNTRNRFQKLPGLMVKSADFVAVKSLAAADAGRVVYVPSGFDKAMAWIARALPRAWAQALVRLQTGAHRKRR
ncbi:MAG: SDR family oxidoreductase [Pseudomonadota bacterium]